MVKKVWNSRATVVFGLILLSISITHALGQKKPRKEYLRHVVVFKFKETSSDTEVQKVVDAFMSLKNTVPQIKEMEWGINNSPENHHQGFTHCFMISFKSEKDLADYQNDLNHKAFQEVLKPHMDKVFVVDYWIR